MVDGTTNHRLRRPASCTGQTGRKTSLSTFPLGPTEAFRPSGVSGEEQEDDNMNRFAIIGAAVAFAGCVDLPTDTKTDDDTTCVTPTKNSTVTIDTVDITCDTTRQVSFIVSTTGGVAADGTIFAQETGNSPQQFSDEHDLNFDDSDACGSTSVLSQTLTTDTAFADAVPNTSTVFSCDADTHYDADVMTYAIHIFDDTGNQLDCLVAGNNPSDLIDGTSDRVADPSEDVSSCATGSISAY